MEQPLTAQPSLLVRLFGDRGYYAALFHIALPIALQNLVTSSLSMVSVVFIGQLGDATVAALGLSNQVFFLLTFSPLRRLHRLSHVHGPVMG